MEHSSALTEILVLLAAAVIAVMLFSRLGLGAALGYLAAGMVIGPWALGLVSDPDDIRHIAEFGVVFLLFLIGMELKPQRLWVMRRLVFGLGGAQVLVTGILMAGVAWGPFGLPPGAALVAGFGFALSSTAFGVQILAERNQLSSQWGRASFSVLLLQDAAVVPLLAMVPLLADRSFDVGESMGIALLETIAIIGAVLLVGRFGLNPVLRAVAGARSREAFIALALLLVLGAAWVMESAGLSLAMGAFIAGMLLAESEFRHQVEADIEPFRGLLLGLFFMSVGMGINLGVLLDHAVLIVLCVLGLLSVKALIVFGLCRIVGLNIAGAIRSAVLLSQAGEFGFVLFTFADREGLLPQGALESMLSVVVLSMAATPFMVRLGEWAAERFGGSASTASAEGFDSIEHPVLIAGFGRVGETVARMLQAVGLKSVIVEQNMDRVDYGRRIGMNVIYGDAARLELLDGIGAKRARLAVITLDSARAAEHMLRALKHHYPDLPVHVRARDLKTAEHLRALGADQTMAEALEASIRLGAAAFDAAGVDEAEKRKLLDGLREGNYQGLAKLMAGEWKTD